MSRKWARRKWPFLDISGQKNSVDLELDPRSCVKEDSLSARKTTTIILFTVHVYLLLDRRVLQYILTTINPRSDKFHWWKVFPADPVQSDNDREYFLFFSPISSIIQADYPARFGDLQCGSP